jgi:translation initiation factor 1
VSKANNSGGTLKHNPFAGLAQVVAPSVARDSLPSPEGASPVAPREDAVLPRKTIVIPDQVTLRQETKGRHGKTVTRVTGFASGDLAALASQLKKALGCGAIVEDGDLLLLGAVAERAADWFRIESGPVGRVKRIHRD